MSMTVCKIKLAGSSRQHRALRSELRDDPEGWGGVGAGKKSQREEIYAYMQLILFVVQQKSTQDCKAITVQRQEQNSKTAQ